jgi:VCBS repeat-containing protein
MSTKNIKSLLKYALLQLAAEALLDRADELADKLDFGNNRSSKFTPEQAAEFAQIWEVVAHQPNTSTGFSGTLFRVRTDAPLELAAKYGAVPGEYTLSFRSTEFADDYVRDNIATNTMEVSEHGFAFGQIADMQNWIAQLRQDPSKWPPGQKVDVTGYSLGGHLVGALNLLSPELILQGATFNGAGVGEVIAFRADDGAVLRSVIAQFDRERKNADGQQIKFSVAALQPKYEALKAKIANGLPITDQDIFDVGATPAGQSAATFQERQRFVEALRRVKKVFEEIAYLATVHNGDKPPPVKHDFTTIAAASLDYQLAALNAATRTNNIWWNSGGFAAGPGYLGVRSNRSYPAINPTPIWDVFGATPPSAVANSQRHYGTPVAVWIEDQPLKRGTVVDEIRAASMAAGGLRLLVNNFSKNDFGDTHSLVLLVDSLATMQVMQRLDASLTLRQASSLFDRASHLKKNTGLLGNDGIDNQGLADGDSLENVVNDLSALFNLSPGLKGNPNGGTWFVIESTNGYTGRGAFHLAIAAIESNPTFKALEGAVRFETQHEVSLARKDFAAFISLTIGARFSMRSKSAADHAAVEQALSTLYAPVYANFQEDRALVEQGKPPKHYSTQYLRDRSAYLNSLSSANKDNAPENEGVISPSVSVPALFIDQVNNKKVGQAPGAATPKVIFGTPEGEAIEGGSAHDRIYGGHGNDTLDGQEGTDYLEGGQGNDTYVFSGLFGKDAVFDSDGSGTIKIDGQIVAATFEGAGRNNEFHAKIPGGRLTLKLVRDGTKGSGYNAVLTSSLSQGNSITIESFDLAKASESQGYLGIKLPPSNRVALIATDEAGVPAGNPWADVNFDSASLAAKNSKLVERGAQSFAVYLDSAASAGAKIKISATGEAARDLKVILGDRKVDLADAVIELVDGQLMVRFAIVSEKPITADVLGSLKVSYEEVADPQDPGAEVAPAVESNSWGLKLVDSKEVQTDELVGDYKVKVVRAGQDLSRTNGHGVSVRVVSQGDASYQFEAGSNLGQAAEGVMLVDNVLFGSAERDKIDGKTGDDALGGGDGNDEIDGSEGNDFIGGGKGSDLLRGGDGDDYISGASTVDPYAQLMSPTDHWSKWALPVGIKPEDVRRNNRTWGVYYDSRPGKKSVLTVSTDVDRTDTAGDVIFAGAGDDIALGSWGNDFADGGDDNDDILGLAGNDVIDGGSGNDVILGDGLIDPDPTSAALNITDAANHGDDFLDGGEGDDDVDGQGGADQIFGGAGDDTLSGDGFGEGSLSTRIVDLKYHGHDYLDGEDGKDYLEGGAKDDTLMGGAGNDAMFGDFAKGMLKASEANSAEAWGKDHLDGEEGDDYLAGGGNDDELFGGLGKDVLVGDSEGADGVPDAFHGDDYLDGEEGEDVLVGGGGKDQLFGGADDDQLNGDYASGQSGVAGDDDYLDGEGGNDKLFGGGKNDRVFGGEGNDTLYGDGSLGSVASAMQGNDYLDGEAGDDILVGGGKDDELYGGTGHDLLVGDSAPEDTVGLADGKDYLDGGEGNDKLVGGGTDDQLFGGDGDDELVGDYVSDSTVRSAEGVDALDGGAGNDKLFGGGQGDHLMGGTGNDVLVGDYASNDTTGGAEGNDLLEGGEGNDALLGGAGDDVLEGGSGDDVLLGGKGNDILMGGGGADAMDGGEGDDVYVFDDNDAVAPEAVTGVAAPFGRELLSEAPSGGEREQNREIVRFDDGGSTGSVRERNGANEVLGETASDSFSAAQPMAFETVAAVPLKATVITDTAGKNTLRWTGGDVQVQLGNSVDAQLTANDLVLRAGNAVVVVKDGVRGSGVSNVEVNGEAQSMAGLAGERLQTAVFVRSSAAGQSLLGGALSDVLIAEHDGVVLSGGRGDDRMEIGNSTVLLVNAGDGKDNVRGYGKDLSIQLGSGLSLDHVRLVVSYETGSSETRLLLNEAGDQYLVLNPALLRPDEDAGTVAPLKTITSANGQVLSLAQLLAAGLDVDATGAGSYVDGTSGNDRILVTADVANRSVYGSSGDDEYVVAQGALAQLQDFAGQSTLRLGGVNSSDEIQITRIGQTNDVLVSTAAGTQIVVKHGLTNGPNWRVAVGNEFKPLNDFWQQWPGITIQSSQFAPSVISGTYTGDTLVGNYHADDLRGYAGNDELRGRAGDDVLDGGEHADLLFGEAGDDTLIGGRGADLLQGGDGSDTYYFAAGDGNDTIIDYEGISKIVLGQGLRSQDMVIEWDATSTDLVLRWGATAQLNIPDGLANAEFTMEFADGTRLTQSEVLNLRAGAPKIFKGTAGPDTLVGTTGDDLLLGRDDFDVLTGGAGDDLLQGGNGADTYHFKRGDGKDRLLDTDPGTLLHFANDVQLDDVRMTLVQEGAAQFVKVQYSPTDWVLVVGNFATLQLLSFRFDSTGNVITGEELMSTAVEGGLAVVGTSGSDRLYGTAGADTLTGAGGADVFLGGAGDDVYVIGGAAAANRIADERGANTLRFEAASTLNQLKLTRRDTDLLIVNLADGSRTLVQNFFTTTNGWKLLLGTEATAEPKDLRQWIASGPAELQTLTNSGSAADRREAFYSMYAGPLGAYTFTDGRSVAFDVGTLTVLDGEATSNYSATRNRRVIQNSSAFSEYLSSAALSASQVYSHSSSSLVSRAVSSVVEETVIEYIPQPKSRYYIDDPLYYFKKYGGLSVSLEYQDIDVPDKKVVSKIFRTDTRYESDWVTRDHYNSNYSVQMNINDVRSGEENNHIIFRGDAPSLIDGGGGDDLIERAPDPDLSAAEGFGHGPQDTSFGSWLYGGAGNDIVKSGLGADEIDGGAGTDYLDGGLGQDLYVVDRFDSGNDLINDSGAEFIRYYFSTEVYGELPAAVLSALREMSDAYAFIDRSLPFGDRPDPIIQTIRWDVQGELGEFGREAITGRVLLNAANIQKLLDLKRQLDSAPKPGVFEERAWTLGLGDLERLIASSAAFNGAPLESIIAAGLGDTVKITGGVNVSDVTVVVRTEEIQGQSMSVAQISWAGGRCKVVMDSTTGVTTRGVEFIQFDSGQRLSWDQLRTALPSSGFRDLRNGTPPASVSLSLSANEDAVFSKNLRQTFSERWVGAVTFSVDPNTPLPSWLILDPSTGELLGTPLQADVGQKVAMLRAQDATGAVTAIRIDLSVLNVNDKPISSGSLGEISTTTGETLVWTIANGSFTDGDPGDVLTYSITQTNGASVPNWLSFDAQTGRLTGTAPSTAAAQVLNLQVTATDAAGASAVSDLVLTINRNVSTATPGDDQLFGDGSANSLDGLAGNDRIYGGGGNDLLIGGLGDDVLNGEAGVDTYLYRLGDGNDVIEASEAQEALEFGQGIALQQLRYARTGGNDLLIQVTSSGATLLGQITIKNWFADAQTRLSVLRFAGGEQVTLDNALINKPPTAQPDDVVLDLSASPTVSINVLVNDVDPDGDGLKVVQSGQFAGTYGAFSVAESGALVYTSSAAAVASLAAGQSASDVLTYTAIDPHGASSQAQVTVRLVGKNDAPAVLLPIQDQNVAQAQAWSYRLPAATFGDVDQGDALRFSATLQDGTPLPAWLSFDAITGTFSGVPKNQDAGTYEIQIRATDWADVSVTDTFRVSVSELPGAVINGTNRADTLTGGAGDDRIDGLGGTDRMIGGEGDDVYYVNVSTDEVIELANEGTDTIISAQNFVLPSHVENLVLTGSANSRATGNSANNAITGNSGNNRIDGGAGADRMEGQAGDDTYTVEHEQDVIVELAGGGVDLVLTSVSYVLPDHLEAAAAQGSASLSIKGNGLSNSIRASDAGSSLYGLGGDDELVGESGNDRLYGGEGIDSLSGAQGDDVLDGGDGDDALSGGSGDDQLFGGFGNDNLVAGGGSDLLSGDDGNDSLSGDSGADLLFGGKGDDSLIGSGSGDLLMGGMGTDVLDAGTGSDWVSGGKGIDRIVLGSGADVLAFNRGDGADRLQCEAGQKDVLSLGGGISLSDVRLRRQGQNLVVELGEADSITLEGWYESPSMRSVKSLQLIVAASADFQQNSTDQLRSSKVAVFDFVKLVNAFDRVGGSSSPGADAWAIEGSALSAWVSGSNMQAIGGDLSWRYGMLGSFADMTLQQLRTNLAGAASMQATSDPATAGPSPWDTLVVSTQLWAAAPEALEMPFRHGSAELDLNWLHLGIVARPYWDANARTRSQ